MNRHPLMPPTPEEIRAHGAIHQSPEVTAEAFRILAETINARDRRIHELEAENRRLRRKLRYADDYIQAMAEREGMG